MKYLRWFARTIIKIVKPNTIPQKIAEDNISVSNAASIIVAIAMQEKRNEPAKVVANILRANLATTYELIRFRIADIIDRMIIFSSYV
jgi:hypothetical protein